ncbi:hypothetical protein ZIOFF_010803 [Zingiber officinale]|uniref:Uncharacterized protein n=1 Tax=Zingiber officinale TaxID=94328 RepID=A0A8J5HHI1_ZINOF|nr:hypothetical protein ZIOFF_010803 [Zingiber officinale]
MSDLLHAVKGKDTLLFHCTLAQVVPFLLLSIVVAFRLPSPDSFACQMIWRFLIIIIWPGNFEKGWYLLRHNLIVSVY